MSVNKSPSIEKLLEGVFGRTSALEGKTCTSCKSSVGDDSFKSELEMKEYQLSGLCPDCQSQVFDVGLLKDKMVNLRHLREIISIVTRDRLKSDDEKVMVNSDEFIDQVMNMTESIILDNLNSFIEQAFEHCKTMHQ